MLTRFFRQSKPINYLVIIALVLVFFVQFYLFLWPFTLDTDLFSRMGALIVLLVSLGILNFVVRRNVLTRKSSYAIYFLAFYSLSLPVLFDQPSILISGMFIMLALRRIISLRSHLEVQKKIFDAALWIFVASLFYFWAVLFIGVLYLGILLHVAGSYKNWLIPLVSLLITGILAVAFALAAGAEMMDAYRYLQLPVYDYTAYSRPGLLVPVSFFAAMYLWCVFRYLGQLGSVPKKMKPSYVLVLASSFVAIIIAAVFAHAHDGSEVYFLFAPLSIISARYVDRSKSKWFTEMLLWLTIALPVLLLIFWF